MMLKLPVHDFTKTCSEVELFREDTWMAGFLYLLNANTRLFSAIPFAHGPLVPMNIITTRIN